MTALRFKALLVLLLAVVAFGGAQAWRPTSRLADTRPAVELETLFPKAFGDWVTDERMPVQLVSPVTAELLNKIYNQTLSRTYVNPAGDRIMLSVAYGGDQSDGTRAHRPEVCYPAQGFQMLSSQTSRLALPTQTLRVRQLVATKGRRNEPITYWMTIGDTATTTGTETKLAQLAYSVRGLIPDGMLIRVSSIDDDNVNAFRMQAQFVAQLASAVIPDQKAVVIGKPGV
jgi:EpsI family protein